MRYSQAELHGLLHNAEVIGRGAFGTVYKCSDGLRDYAVKLTSDERSYQREVTALGTLHHRNIVSLHGHGHYSAGEHALVYEFCVEGSLGSAIRDRRLTPSMGLEILKGAASALACAHARGYLHGDLKPGNILLDKNFSPKVSR